MASTKRSISGSTARWVADHVAGGHPGGGDDRRRPTGIGHGQVGGVGRHHEVAPEVEVALAVAQLVAPFDRIGAHDEVGDHGAALLRQSRLVEPPHPQAVGQGGGAENLRRRHHAGPTHTEKAHRPTGGGGHDDGGEVPGGQGVGTGAVATDSVDRPAPGNTEMKEGQSPSTQV